MGTINAARREKVYEISVMKATAISEGRQADIKPVTFSPASADSPASSETERCFREACL